MKILTKIRWIASILLVFIVVLLTNLIDRENFNRLSYSVTTMYEDRIVASDVLFELSRIIQEKEIAIYTSDSLYPMEHKAKLDDQIDVLLDKYRQTKLTPKENFIFQQVEEELKTLQKLESKASKSTKEKTLKSIETVDHHLVELSKIQLQEGKRQVFASEKVKNSINLFTQGEIIFLVLMAILVQVIILYKPSRAKEN
ncbi:MCP four helix bundle domain-containing protein [Croceimicrobium hydrocarbonivorans]|uniref:MCP four helix bundle domain-containing protein n=1 Tax=Croceimicrobium hydrocarbonivorans TaxID=2761580 RepID=A0A7H0VHG5_9FLAO|nr:MCP four helix bundle domain-containing protein [Croceimicrobium hydrocarbonivorans]QNR25163.1 MCP four helix bundle domain-containing protein [Croceimicrobium hydrocarbonivorans]